MISLCSKVILLIGFIAGLAESSETSELEECQDGWVAIHRGCYRFVEENMEWESARDYCKNLNGELTSIQSVKEKEGIETYMSTHDQYRGVSEWWIGFQKEGSKIEWLARVPVDESVISWANRRWKSRPGNWCGILDQSRGLRVHLGRCTDKKPFMCEFHAITDRPSVAPTSSTVVGVTITESTASTTHRRHVADKTEKNTINIRRPGATVTDPSIRRSNPTVVASTRNGGTEVEESTAPESPIKNITPRDEGQTESESEIDTEATDDGEQIETPDEQEESTSTPETTGEGRTRAPKTQGGVDTDVSAEESRLGKGQHRKSTGGPNDRDDESTESDEPTVATHEPTQPAKTPLYTPEPTMVDWEKSYEEFEECYIPGTGGSLSERVMAAKRFYVDERTGCPAVKMGNIQWENTEADEEATQECANGKGYATFSCGSSPICWKGQPDITGCANQRLQSLLKMVSKPTTAGSTIDVTDEPPTVEESIELSSRLVEVTEDEGTTMEDVLVTSDIIQALTKKKPGEVRSKEQVEKLVDNVVKASSNLVSANKSAMWEEMTQEDKVRSASSLLIAMEDATVSMAAEIEEPTRFVQKDENLELELRVVDTEDLEREQKTELVYDSVESDNSFSIPVETLKSASKGGLAKAVFITHYSMSDILGKKKKKKKEPKYPVVQASDASVGGDQKDVTEDKEGREEVDVEEEEEEEDRGPQLVSYILSASLGSDGPILNLPKPISFTMKHFKEVEAKYIPLCSFWNISTDSQTGFWSQKGCQVMRTNKTHTTCECDHMTNFAILLDVHGLEMAPVHKTYLRLVTIIGCIISCVSLLAAWVTFQCFLSLQGERNSIHKNLAFTLLVAEILFVFGIDQTDQPVLCSVIAGFLHYFFLSAFTWMFLEGIHIIFMLVQVFDSSRSRLPYYYITGYGAPLVIIGASCLFFYEGYGTDQYCWLTTDRYFIWAFAGPVAIILLVNALFLTYAMSTVCRHADYVFSSKEKTPASGIRGWIQGALALEVLLGLTWTLGYFLINENSLPLAYVFAVLNSLQGLFIFVFHCLLNKKAQKEYRRVARTMVKRTPSTTTQSTFTKRSNNTRNSHEMNHSHENNHHNHNSNHNNSHSPTSSQQKLNATNSHSMA